MGAQSMLSVADSPVAFVKTSLMTNDDYEVEAVLGKVIESRNDPNQGKYAICPKTGVAIDGETCYYSVATYTAPGRPSQIDFYDPTDVNKSVVAKARIECIKAKSVFKSLIDFFLDLVVTWMDSLL